jgi:hypothetical protein
VDLHDAKVIGLDGSVQGNGNFTHGFVSGYGNQHKLLSGHFPEWFRAHDYFVDSRLIKTTSRTITNTAITVQSHTPPPIQPSIHPYVWFIIRLLSLRCDPPAVIPGRER